MYSPRPTATVPTVALATLMNLGEDAAAPATRQYIDDHTLIRRIELFDPQAIRWNRELSLRPGDSPVEFVIDRHQLPHRLPDAGAYRNRMPEPLR